MPSFVVSGASIQCSMGTTPGTLMATSQQTVLMNGKPAATVRDVVPITSVTPCGMCTSLANPTVASATAAALGVLTPMPCVPAPAGIWVGGSAGVMAGGMPCLTNTATLTCAYGGSIRILSPGQINGLG